MNTNITPSMSADELATLAAKKATRTAALNEVQRRRENRKARGKNPNSKLEAIAMQHGLADTKPQAAVVKVGNEPVMIVRPVAAVEVRAMRRGRPRGPNYEINQIAKREAERLLDLAGGDGRRTDVKAARALISAFGGGEVHGQGLRQTIITIAKRLRDARDNDGIAPEDAIRAIVTI